MGDLKRFALQSTLPLNYFVCSPPSTFNRVCGGLCGGLRRQHWTGGRGEKRYGLERQWRGVAGIRACATPKKGLGQACAPKGRIQGHESAISTSSLARMAAARLKSTIRSCGSNFIICSR